MSENKKIKELEKALKKTNEQMHYLEKSISFKESAPGISHEINNNINLVTGFLQVLNIRVNSFSSLIENYKKLVENTYSLHKQFQDMQALTLESVSSNKISNQSSIDFQSRKNILCEKLAKQIENLYEENPIIADMDEILELEETKEELLEANSAIKLAFNRIHEISYDLSMFGKKEESEPIMVNINESIQHTLFVMKKKIGKNIEVRTMLNELPEINSYRGKLNQVFTNLIKNALESIEEKEKKSDNEYIQIETKKENNNIVIIIIDTGGGMTAETQQKLFKEFYTTKGERGTGLGMGVCRSIIEKHKGVLSYSSELGKGTTFKIVLPLN